MARKGDQGVVVALRGNFSVGVRVQLLLGLRDNCSHGLLHLRLAITGVSPLQDIWLRQASSTHLLRLLAFVRARGRLMEGLGSLLGFSASLHEANW